MNEEEIVGTEAEKQAYRDQLKRMSRKLLADYEDEIKKIKFIQHTYPHFTQLDAMEVHSSNNYAAFYNDFTGLTDVSSAAGEPSNNFLERWLKSLKQHVHELRTFIHNFERDEGVYYEMSLARVLAHKGQISPEQVAPKSLQDLPNFGSIGGKKRTKRARHSKRKTRTTRTKRKKNLKKNTRKKSKRGSGAMCSRLRPTRQDQNIDEAAEEEAWRLQEEEYDNPAPAEAEAFVVPPTVFASPTAIRPESPSSQKIDEFKKEYKTKHKNIQQFRSDGAFKKV